MSWLGEARAGGLRPPSGGPGDSLVTCPPDLEPAIAVLAEPLAVAMHAVSRLTRRPDDALVLGYGPIGALVHLELVRRWPDLAVSISEPAADRRRLGLALGALPAPEPLGTGPGGGGDRAHRRLRPGGRRRRLPGVTDRRLRLRRQRRYRPGRRPFRGGGPPGAGPSWRNGR